MEAEIILYAGYTKTQAGPADLLNRVTTPA